MLVFCFSMMPKFVSLSLMWISRVQGVLWSWRCAGLERCSLRSSRKVCTIFISLMVPLQVRGKTGRTPTHGRRRYTFDS